MIESQLIIESKLENVSEVRRWLEGLTAQAGFNEEDIGSLKLVVSEACSNIIRHAYKGEDGHDIVISACIDDEKLALNIRDFGTKIDLSKYEKPSLGEPQEGGYGIFLMHTLMDSVEYDTSAEVGTTLRLVKLKSGK
jgi:anti-sigma regulatory factor (Ser/Thr protein kinase)